MLNFEYSNPTKLIFGSNQWDKLPMYLHAMHAQRILLAYGGGTMKRNGFIAKIRKILSDFECFEFGGIEANPEFEVLQKGVAFAQDCKVDFILAIGGGSVIDGVKFIAGAFYYEKDPWEVLQRKPGTLFSKALPFGTILTMPATGSEANSGAVISRKATNEKRTMGGPLFFPKFSFCDPSFVATLPSRQIANGIVDAYMHTMEQYLTYPSGNRLQERQAEAILQTLLEIGPALLKSPEDIELAGNFMWCATHALNGNLRCGVPTDWCTHMIGHELTAHFGIDHARTLAIIAPRLWEHQQIAKRDKLKQYGSRVFGLDPADDSSILEVIRKTEYFFQDLGIPTRLSDYTSTYEGAAEKIRQTFIERDWLAMGERGAITPEDVYTIVKSSY